MIFVVFESEELFSQNTECIEFAKTVMRDINVIIITTDENYTKTSLEKHGIQNSCCRIVVRDSLEAFLSECSDNLDCWYLAITDKPIITSDFGSHFAACPFHFWGELDAFKESSFTEHAKKKLIYNELSWLYMDSIVNDTSLEVSFLKTLFENHNVQSVIDCCCGVGRHSARLGELGFRVTGIDASQAQIETATTHNKNENVNYIVHDVRNFALNNQDYDAAICMWTTYNYLSQDKDLLVFINNVWRHLRPNGLLVLDSKNIPILQSRRFYHRTTERENLHMTLLVYKRVMNMIQNSQYFYFIDCEHEGHHEIKFCLDEEFVRFYSLKELQSLLHSRFNLIKAFGDFHGTQFNPEVSERMITVWEKCDF